MCEGAAEGYLLGKKTFGDLDKGGLVKSDSCYGTALLGKSFFGYFDPTLPIRSSLGYLTSSYSPVTGESNRKYYPLKSYKEKIY